LQNKDTYVTNTIHALIGFSLGFGFGYKDKLGINLAWTPSISELNQHVLNAGVSFKF
jgi:hypothetical protein